MTPHDAFKLGFLLRCAEEGCTPDEIRGRVKTATLLKQSAGPAITAGTGIGAKMLAKFKGLGKALPLWAGFTQLPYYATSLGLAASAATGAGAGYGLAKLQNQDVDPEEAKRQELIAAYKLQAELARQRASRRSYRQPIPSSPRLF